MMMTMMIFMELTVLLRKRGASNSNDRFLPCICQEVGQHLLQPELISYNDIMLSTTCQRNLTLSDRSTGYCDWIDLLLLLYGDIQMLGIELGREGIYAGVNKFLEYKGSELQL
jgi:hypothetical protein